MKVEDILHAESQAQGGDSNRWLLTWADLISLLMAFFILLISISDISPQKLKQVSQSTATSLGTTGAAKRVEIYDIASLVKAVEKIIAEEKLSQQVEVAITARGVIVSGRGATFFQSGSATILPQAIPLLKKLAKQIRTVPYSVDVEGHTDNVPIKTGQFPSNWELSSARASQIVRILLDNHVPSKKLRAVGMADTVPKVPNADKKGKPISKNQAINRRIEIVFRTS